jgi:hypothetical protein
MPVCFIPTAKMLIPVPETRRKARFSLGLYNPRSSRDLASFYMVAFYILPFTFGIE